MSIHDRLKSVISNSGLTIPQFARRTGVARNTLIRYRDGETSIPFDFLEKVCDEFDVDRAELLLGETCQQPSGGIPYDRELMRQVIEVFAECLEDTGQTDMSPKKKAYYSVLLYEHFIREEGVKRETIVDYLKLAS